MKSQYFIELECICEDYDGIGGKLNCGDIVYLHPQSVARTCERFTNDIENSWKTFDIKMAKVVAKEIYKNGNFLPKIKEIYRNVGAEIYIDYDNC